MIDLNSDWVETRIVKWKPIQAYVIPATTVPRTKLYRNPCPLVLIGLPDSIVTFHEGKAALAEVEAAEDAEQAAPAAD